MSELTFPLPEEYLASLLHKLRGPLAAISAQAETLAEGILGPLSPPQDEAVHSIREELAHSLGQLEGLEELWIRRPVADTAPTVAADLPQVIRNVLEQTASQLENRQIHLQLAESPSLPEHSPSAPALRRLLQRLITCQAVLVPKGATIRLHIGSMPLEAGSLKNSPPAETQLVRLEPVALLLLQRAGDLLLHQPEGQPPALGIRLHDGWACWLDPLPAAAAPRPLVPEPDSAPPGRPLILLADDQAAVSSVLGNFLEDLGFQVEKATDGLEVVRMARQCVPSLIMMDLRMPLLSGIDALQQIRNAADPAVQAIPVVCMSGFATAEEEARCLAAGAQAFLRKPFRPADLTALLPAICKAEVAPGPFLKKNV
jgi:CheY-like chemotaxis protein